MPAAGRAVTGGLAVAELATADLHGPVLVADGAKSATGGARLGLAEALGLLGGGLLQGAGGQAAGGGDGDLFHGGEIDVEAGAVVAEGVADNDFPPLVGQVVDFLEVLGGEFPGRHDLNLFGVGANEEEEFSLVVVEQRLWHAKRFLHSERVGHAFSACPGRRFSAECGGVSRDAASAE